MTVLAINECSGEGELTTIRRISQAELSIGTQIGAGGYGKVYKGWLGQMQVAIKSSIRRNSSLVNELKQLSRLEHENITSVLGYCVGKDDDFGLKSFSIVMEYAEEGSLHHLLHERKKEFNLKQACSWALQIAKGVAYMHATDTGSIIHRDLKPMNLLLFSNSEIIKVCDFGLARQKATNLTKEVGTFRYLAPEVLDSCYNEKVDVYSWAIIYWEILVRKQPFMAESEFLIIIQSREGRRPKIIENCSGVIQRVILKAWDKNPDLRPSMEDIVRKMEFICELTQD